MIHKLFKPMLAVTLAASMVLPMAQSAFASSPQAMSSPEKPLSYTNAWHSINPGEWQWYAIKYDHVATEKASEEHKADTEKDIHIVPADIQLYSQPLDGVTLMLLNGDEVRAWEHGNALTHFGAATDVVDTIKKSESLARFCRTNTTDAACNTSGAGIHSGSRCVNTPTSSAATARCETISRDPLGYANWSGDFGATGTYYILVQRAANASGPAQYRFTINGDGVTLK